MTITKEQVSTARLEEMLAGLEGVTPGPWHMYGEPEVGLAPEPFSGSVGKGDMEPVYRSHENLAHIARLDPDTMRSILTELLASRALRSSSEPVVKGLTLANGTKAQCDYPDSPNWARSWTLTDPNGKVATNVQDWELVEEFGLTAILSAIVASPQEEPVEAVAWRNQCAASDFHDHDGCSCSVSALRTRYASPQLSQPNTSGVDGALAGIVSLIGNVDHSKGGGENTARLYGGMLNDIRDIASAVLRTPAAGEVSEAEVEAGARAIAYDEWPLATDAERSAWAEKHYHRYMSASRAALEAASATRRVG